jgi:prepilin-type N-terminal cleavage/methylation domain-containing protein
VLKHLRNSEAFEQKNLLQKGFTLVELLVVIVILGILAAVVVFAVSGSTTTATSKSCKSEASTLASAMEAYAAQNAGTYPTTWADMIKGSSTTNTDGDSNTFLRSSPSARFSPNLPNPGDVKGIAKCAGVNA